MTTVTLTPELDYAILGAVAARRVPDASPIRLGQQTKLLLARLLRDAGALVTVDAIAGALWGEEDRASRRDGVHHAVRTARGLLGDTERPHRVIVVDGDAYRIVVGNRLAIDAERFKQLSAVGHELVAARAGTARAMLAEALAAWRGPLFGEFADRPWAAGHAAELDRLRHRTQIDLGEAMLALGEHAELEATLRREIFEHPHDERLRGQLVRALLGDGRATEALIAFREAVVELGGAGPELMRLGEQAARAPLEQPAPPAGTRARAGRRAGPAGSIVLCADLDVAGRAREQPGAGTMCLIAGAHGGVARPVGAHGIVATFDDADVALLAARALTSDRRLAARIGVHAGAVIDLGDDVIGPGPARCRQLMQAAHRGQVLVSADAVAGGEASHGLRELGEHRFADLGPGAALYELPSPYGVDFGLPATLARRPHNLPVQRTRFVGRAEELAALSQRVTPGAVITLTGPGGCGKTRLALQLAASNIVSFADGAWFAGLAELAPGAGIEAVATAIANQLSVRALREETLPAAVLRHLSDRAALVIVDNCEQVHEACAALIGELNARCPGVCVIATSRRRLGIDGELAIDLKPMATVARTPGALSDAAELLLERAGPLPADLPDLSEALAHAESICEAFDGLPLAIELAAGQVMTRTLAGVAAEVAGMLAGDRPFGRYASPDPRRPERHRTIESAIEWGYRLLDDRERQVLRRLAVFHGTFGEAEACRLAHGCGYEAAEVTAILASLVECSMVVADLPLAGAPRMRLLEPIRGFAFGLLGDGELEPARAEHAEVFLDLAMRIAPGFLAGDEHACLERLEADHDNLRAALDWYVGAGRGTEALRLVGAMWWLWFSHGHLEEGCERVRSALEIAGEPSPERVRALGAASHLSWWRGDLAQCHAYNVELEACAEAIGDEWGKGWATMAHGAVEMFRDPRRALVLFDESKRRFEALGRAWEAGYALHVIGGARWFAGEEQAAREAYEAAVEIFERLGHSSVLASARRGAGLMAAHCGQRQLGDAMCLAALRLSDAIGDRAGSAQALNFLAAISRDHGEYELAAARYADALRLAREVGELWATCWALDGLGGVARAVGEPEIATRLLAHSGRLAARTGYGQSPHELRLRTEHIAALRRTLGEDEFERASAEGALLGVGAAVSSALAFAARHAR